MVAYLGKSERSAGFHEIIDFLSSSHIHYAFTENPTIYVSFIKQFWSTAAASTRNNGEVELTATIDGHTKTLTGASLRRHLKLEDNGGVSTQPNSEIFEQLALIGYETDYDKLTFQKGNFSPQWRFLIHNILHCLNPKKTSWEQFSSNIATAIICLATNRTYNLSKMIFDAMVKNVDSPHKFLMYPSNMKRVSRGYSGVKVPLFPTMLTAPEISPSRITSSPSQSSEPSPSTSQPHNTQPTPTAEEPAPTPHESPLQSVHSLRRDEGSLSLNELTVLCTSLFKKIEGLESELKQTKQTYNVALTKLIKRGRKISDIDEDPNISLIRDEGMTWFQEDAEGSGEKGEREVSTAGVPISTAGLPISTATTTPDVSTASEMGSAAGIKAKDKGKGIMLESIPSKKIKKRVQIQMIVDEELVKKIFKEEKARFNAEQEARAKEEQE
ncbi:hypothetical protein Tco_0108699 [Tanacetum coccineum]